MSNKVKAEKRGVRFLISLLVRYPAIDLIDINLKNNEIVISFFIKQGLKREELCKKVKLLEDCLNSFDQLCQKQSKSNKIEISSYQSLIQVNLIADIFSLTQRKLDFIIRLVSNFFTTVTYQDNFQAKDKRLESLDNLIEKIKLSKADLGDDFTYLAFREDNQVKVYNKKV